MSESMECLKDKTKRDIFRIDGDKPTAINLEHVNMIQLDKNRITFSFQYTNFALDLSGEDLAKEIYDKIVNLWVSD